MLDGKAEEQHYTVLTTEEMKWLLYIGCHFYMCGVKFETSCWLQVLGDH